MLYIELGRVEERQSLSHLFTNLSTVRPPYTITVALCCLVIYPYTQILPQTKKPL